MEEQSHGPHGAICTGFDARRTTHQSCEVRASMSSRQFRPAPAPGASQFRLKIRRSEIHRVGVFAAQKIPPGRKVIEYAGERVSIQEALRRLRKIWARKGSKHFYLMRLNRYWCVDGAVAGVGGQWINHSCDPNLAPRRNHGHVLLFSTRQIRKGEELSFDYRFPGNSRPVPCKCGSPKCRGTINLN